jgi:hypothetical protein
LTTKVVQADPPREFRERPRCSVLSYPVVSMAVVLGNVKKTIKDLPKGGHLIDSDSQTSRFVMIRP